jgi:hypothetical protein
VAQINLITFPWLVRSVNVQPGGVLLVSVPTDTPAREIERVAQLLKETLNGILPEDAHKGITVEGLDEKMMAQCGWQRIPNPPS